MNVNGPGGPVSPQSTPNNDNKTAKEEEDKENLSPGEGFVLGGKNVDRGNESKNQPKKTSLADRMGKISVNDDSTPQIRRSKDSEE